eukprot:g5903.t1
MNSCAKAHKAVSKDKNSDTDSFLLTDCRVFTGNEVVSTEAQTAAHPTVKLKYHLFLGRTSIRPFPSPEFARVLQTLTAIKLLPTEGPGKQL